MKPTDRNPSHFIEAATLPHYVELCVTTTGDEPPVAVVYIGAQYVGWTSIRTAAERRAAARCKGGEQFCAPVSPRTESLRAYQAKARTKAHESYDRARVDVAALARIALALAEREAPDRVDFADAGNMNALRADLFGALAALTGKPDWDDDARLDARESWGDRIADLASDLDDAESVRRTATAGKGGNQ